MKILVLIPSHSDPVYTKLTIASLLKHHPNYDFNIHIGVHSNYKDYTEDLSLFEDLRNIAQIHLVDEIDWNVHFYDELRYSKMHCKNISNLLKMTQYYDFDKVLHLDNDLLIKKDFITGFAQSNADLVFDYFENNDIIRKVDLETKPSEFNGKMQFAPKITAWNVMFSRKIFDRMLAYPDTFWAERIDESEIIAKYREFLPDLDLDRSLVFDTFSKLLFYCKYIWTDVEILSTDGILSSKIHHFFYSSFNYGVQICNNTTGHNLALNIWNYEYKDFFENLKKIKR